MDAQNIQMFAFFRDLDADGSGTINVGELRQAFVRFGVIVNAYEVKEILTALDQDGDGEIEIVEFMEAMHQARTAHATLKRSTEREDTRSTATVISANHKSDETRENTALRARPQLELQEIGVGNENAATACCADIKAFLQGLQLWKIAGRTRFPAFVSLLCSLALPLLDVATDWAVTWWFYTTGDMNWFKISVTIQLLSGSLSGLLLAGMDFHEKLGNRPHTPLMLE